MDEELEKELLKIETEIALITYDSENKKLAILFDESVVENPVRATEILVDYLTVFESLSVNSNDVFLVHDDKITNPDSLVQVEKLEEFKNTKIVVRFTSTLDGQPKFYVSFGPQMPETTLVKDAYAETFSLLQTVRKGLTNSA